MPDSSPEVLARRLAEMAQTLRFGHEKKPTERGWFFNKWWRRRESNPRPKALYRQFYMLSVVV